MIKFKKADKQTDLEKITANDLTDVRDIVRNVLFTKSGFTIGFLRLYPINIELLTQMEKTNLCDTLTSKFKPEKQPFTIISIPRTIDMDQYMNFLVEKYDNEMSNPKRKMLLNAMISEATEMVMNGQNYEHQFYIKVWEKTDQKNSYQKIEERLNDFYNRYSSIQNQTKRLDDIEIIKLCNLYGNNNTAILETYDSNTQHTNIPFIIGMDNEKR